MKWNLYLGTLVVTLVLSAQSFGFELGFAFGNRANFLCRRKPGHFFLAYSFAPRTPHHLSTCCAFLHH